MNFFRLFIVPISAIVIAAPAVAQTAAEQPAFLNINPSWSPDGSQIVFESWRHGPGEIYVINADGTGERRLTWSDSTTENTHPSWSPNGSTIVFDSKRDGVWHLYTINADGTGARRLTQPGGGVTDTYARHPEWSPDGRFIAFDSSRDGNGEMYVISADGTTTRRLTDTPANESHPLWTPDGKVVFGKAENGARALWVADPATGAQHGLREPSQFYSGANFSPDGTRLVYLSNADSTPRLYVMRVDGSQPARAITPPGRTSYEAAWSRDGRKVAFYMDLRGKHEIYVVDADGQNARQITNVEAGTPPHAE